MQQQSDAHRPPVSTGENPSYALHSDACAVMLQDLQHDLLVSYSQNRHECVQHLTVKTWTQSQQSSTASRSPLRRPRGSSPSHTFHTASRTPLEQPPSPHAQHQSDSQLLCCGRHTACHLGSPCITTVSSRRPGIHPSQHHCPPGTADHSTPLGSMAGHLWHAVNSPAGGPAEPLRHTTAVFSRSAPPGPTRVHAHPGHEVPQQGHAQED